MTKYIVRITVRGKKYILTTDTAEQVASAVNGTPMVSGVEVVKQTFVAGELAEQRELTEAEVFELLGISETVSAKQQDKGELARA